MRTNKVIYLLIAVVFSAVQLHAADTVIVRKDARMDILSAKQIEANKKGAQLTSTGLYKGYRIQVISTGSRDRATDTKAMLGTNFPAQKTYIMYQSPNFKVRIGNFIRREDAETFKKDLAKLFPEGLYIVEDTIEITATEEEEPIILQ